MAATVLSCYCNRENELFLCLHPSHPHLSSEDAQLQTFGPNCPHHLSKLSQGKMTKTGLSRLIQDDQE